MTYRSAYSVPLSPKPVLTLTPEAPWGSNPPPALFCSYPSSSCTSRHRYTAAEALERDVALSLPPSYSPRSISHTSLGILQFHAGALNPLSVFLSRVFPLGLLSFDQILDYFLMGVFHLQEVF